MYIVFAPIQIKEGHETDWINGILENAPRFKTQQTPTESGYTKSTKTKKPLNNTARTLE